MEMASYGYYRYHTSVVINVKVDQQTLDGAAAVLAADNITVSDVLNRVLEYISEEGELPPLDRFVPGPETIAAMDAGERGEVATFASVDELMADLYADD